MIDFIHDELDFIQPKKIVGKMIDIKVIEDIKAEIHEEKEQALSEGSIEFADGLERALVLIGKHIGG